MPKFIFENNHNKDENKIIKMDSYFEESEEQENEQSIVSKDDVSFSVSRSASRYSDFIMFTSLIYLFQFINYLRQYLI